MTRILIALLLVLPATAAHADHDGPFICTDASRECMVTVADTYLAALVDHDPSKVPLAHDAWWQGNGSRSRNGADEIRTAISPPSFDMVNMGIRQLRWYVDGEDATAIYLLDATIVPTPIIERFRVSGGLIHEIEAVFLVDPTGYVVGPDSLAEDPDGVRERFLESSHGPFGPVPFNPGAPPPQNDIGSGGPGATEAVRAYVDAIASGDASGVPLAADAVRTENRRTTGRDAGEIRASMPQGAVRDLRLYVEGDQVVAFFVFATAEGDNWSAGRFRVNGGLIDEIAVICAGSLDCR